MSEYANQFGLRRSDLSEDIRREVRQRCGFGCVVCGSAIVQYHHFDPPFAEAREHRAEGITLLCGGCHDNVTRGLWSESFVRQRNLVPWGSFKHPHHLLDLSPPLWFILGSVIFVGKGGSILTIDGEEVFGVEPIEGEGVAVNARFFDNLNNVILEIGRNELLLCGEQWDATVIGRNIKIHRTPMEIAFEAILHPPNGIYVRKIDLLYKNKRFCTDDNGQINISIDGRPNIDIRDTCIITAGCLHIEEKGCVINGGSALIPYPGARLARFANSGDINQLEQELFAPIIYVATFHAERGKLLDKDKNPIHGAPIGHLRYNVFCEVCNTTILGYRDLPEGSPLPKRSGHICPKCASMPIDGWCVQDPTGEIIKVCINKSDAIALAIDTRSRIPSSRIVVHREKGGVDFNFND